MRTVGQEGTDQPFDELRRELRRMLQLAFCRCLGDVTPDADGVLEPLLAVETVARLRLAAGHGDFLECQTAEEFRETIQPLKAQEITKSGTISNIQTWRLFVSSGAFRDLISRLISFFTLLCRGGRGTERAQVGVQISVIGGRQIF